MNISRILGPLHRRHIQSLVSYKVIPARFSSQASFPVKFAEIENRWKEKDGISRDWNLIYKAPMNNVLTFVSTYVTVTTGLVLGAGAYYATFAFKEDTADKPIVVGTDVILADSPAEGLIYVLAFFSFHVFIKLFLAKYVVRIYQKGDNYLAVFRGHIHSQVFKHKFKLADFEQMPPAILSPWGTSRFKLGAKQAIILESYFKAPEYYNRLLFKRPPKQTDED